jgi:hypothetical protein
MERIVSSYWVQYVDAPDLLLMHAAGVTDDDVWIGADY